MPDRGDATITPITAEQIEAETTYDLKAEASFDFKTGLQGAYIYNSSQTSSTLAATSLDSRTALSLKKTVAASDGGRLLFPLGKTVRDAETIEVSFDIYLDNVADIGNGGTIFRTFFNTDINKSPYDMYIIHKSTEEATGFALGDSGASKGFGKTLAYGEWHNVQLVVSVGDRATDSFLATIYVNGEKYGESTKYFGSADGLVANDVLGFYMYAQKAATFDMYIDDLYMRAYSGPDTKAPVEAAPIPELDSTDSWSFDNGTGNVTASNERGSVTSAQVLGKDAVTLGKTSGGGSQFTFPLSSTVQAEMLKLSFDMYFHHTAADDINYSTNSAAFRFYQNTNYKSSPYSGSIHTYNGGTASDISDDYFTIGDASTATVSGKEYAVTNAALGGHLSFNEWYSIELIIHIGDGTVADFYAVWYVNGEFYGYSTNFYHEAGTTPAPTDSINLVANSLYVYALSSTVFTVSFDNVEISAYNDALKVEPTFEKTWDFEDADALDVTMTTSDKTNNTYVAAVIDGHNAVKLSTLTKDYNVKWKMPLDGAHSVSEIDMQFDLYLSSENISGSFLAYLFLKEGYSDAPYAGMLYAGDTGFSIKNRASTNNNTSKVTDIGGTISYDEWHTVRLVVKTGSGDKSKFLATWYVDGEVYGTSTIFWTSDTSETVPTSVDSFYIFAQKGVTFEAYIDNLTIAVYDIAK